QGLARATNHRPRSRPCLPLTRAVRSQRSMRWSEDSRRHWRGPSRYLAERGVSLAPGRSPFCTRNLVMRTRLLLCLTVALPLLLAGGSGIAQKDNDKTKAGDAIFERAKAFAAAFDKGDAKAIAEFWTEDGDYTDQS